MVITDCISIEGERTMRKRKEPSEKAFLREILTMLNTIRLQLKIVIGLLEKKETEQ